MVHSTYLRQIIYVLGLQKRENNVKPTEIPSKSHSVAVIIGIGIEIFF